MEGMVMIWKLFNRTALTEKALDASWLRNEVIAHNIANVDTPGYKRKTVSFESCLNESNGSASMTRKTRKGHIDFTGRQNEAKVQTDYSELSHRLDGNNVDIEYEMAQLA